MALKKTTTRKVTPKKDALKKLTVPALRAKAKRAGIKLSKTDGSQKTKAQLVLALDKVPTPRKKTTTRRKSVTSTLGAPLRPLQTGASNKFRDIKKEAMKPGKRTSKTGRIYYERRANRSDVSQFLDNNKFTYDTAGEFNVEVGVPFLKFYRALVMWYSASDKSITDKLVDVPELIKYVEGIKIDMEALTKVLKRFDAGIYDDDFDPYKND